MSKSVRVVLSQISGAANAYYSMQDQNGNVIFSDVYGASLSNGITYSVLPTATLFTLYTSSTSGGATGGATGGVGSTSSFAPEIVVGPGEYQQFFIKPNGELWAQSTSNVAFQGTNLVNVPGIPSRCVQQSGDLPRMVKCYGGIHDGKAIDEFGYVWHMGENGIGIPDAGFSGDGGTAWSNYTTRINVDAYGNTFSNVKSVQIFGGNTSAGWVALKNDGTVWVWGLCSGGHRGNGTLGGIELSPVKVDIPGNKFVIKVSAGISIMALCDDGTIYSWGGVNDSSYDVFQSALGYAATGTAWQSPHIVDNVVGATGVCNHGRISFAWSNTKLWYCGHSKYAGINNPSGGPISSFTDITSSISATGGTISFPIKQMVVNVDSQTHLIDANNALWGTGDSGRGALGTGLIADLSLTTPHAWNFFDTYPGAEGTYYSYQWVRVLPERSDFKNIFAIVPWGFNKYFETYDGQLYASGRNKANVIANGVYSNDNTDANHPDSFNVAVATPVSPFTVGPIRAQSPFCLANPTHSECIAYPAPAYLPPTVSAGPTQSIGATSATINGTASAQSGRSISSFVWTIVSKPASATYPYMYGLNNPTLTVTGMTTSGNYVFRLLATDNFNSATSSNVTIIKT